MSLNELIERIDRDVERYWKEQEVPAVARKFHQRFQRAMMQLHIDSFNEFVRTYSKKTEVIETRGCRNYLFPKAAWGKLSDKQKAFFRETGMIMKVVSNREINSDVK